MKMGSIEAWCSWLRQSDGRRDAGLCGLGPGSEEGPQARVEVRQEKLVISYG
jgi:hypothetical protein